MNIAYPVAYPVSLPFIYNDFHFIFYFFYAIISDWNSTDSNSIRTRTRFRYLLCVGLRATTNENIRLNLLGEINEHMLTLALSHMPSVV